MSTAFRYALPIVLALALFTGTSYLIVSATSRSWFEDDVRLRAQLVLRSSRDALSARWGRGDQAGVQKLLADITTDERILAAAACAPDGTAFARTSDFPPQLG